MKHLSEFIPMDKFKEDDPLDFGKCKKCGKEYYIYHVVS